MEGLVHRAGMMSARGRLTPTVQLWSAFETGPKMLTVRGAGYAHNLMPVAPSVATNVRWPPAGSNPTRRNRGT